jgi:hypothetical protein
VRRAHRQRIFIGTDIPSSQYKALSSQHKYPHSLHRCYIEWTPQHRAPMRGSEGRLCINQRLGDCHMVAALKVAEEGCSFIVPHMMPMYVSWNHQVFEKVVGNYLGR